MQRGKADKVARPIGLTDKKLTRILNLPERTLRRLSSVLTALQPMMKVGIKDGDRVLITAAGGGVGHFAVQFAKYFGAHVIALASKGKMDFVTSLGADEFVDYQQGRFEQQIADVDLAVEAVKQDRHIQRSMQVVKPGGSLISLWSHVNDEERAEADRRNAMHSIIWYFQLGRI